MKSSYHNDPIMDNYVHFRHLELLLMTLFLTGRFTDCAKISKKCEYIAELQLHARYISLNESFFSRSISERSS